jgi:UDP-N-acetylmuramate dehydrogenase
MIGIPHTLSPAALRAEFGGRVRFDAPLAPYTAARIGGAADVFITVESADELARAAGFLWAAGAPFMVLGGGSNVLVSDAGLRGAALFNRARAFRFEEASVWAESGANFGALARQAAARGLGGLEWAAGIPGTVGGAVFGNAGAHGGDTAGSLLAAEVLLRGGGRADWDAAHCAFGYRTSLLKREAGSALVLAATFRLERAAAGAISTRMDDYLAHRRRTQPPGASMGSMFKNPPGDFAGRLIEAAGLKGTRIGAAEISPLHANFFINHGGARAADVLALIQRARQAVLEQFGVTLELEVELAGEWGAHV